MIRPSIKRRGRVAVEHDAGDGAVVAVARLDLLAERVDVAEAAVEGAGREDRVDPGGLVDPVGDLDRLVDRRRGGEAEAGALPHVYGRPIVGRRHDLGAGLQHIGTAAVI